MLLALCTSFKWPSTQLCGIPLEQPISFIPPALLTESLPALIVIKIRVGETIFVCFCLLMKIRGLNKTKIPREHIFYTSCCEIIFGLLKMLASLKTLCALTKF